MQQITEEFISNLTKKNVLSLDIATKCGYYSSFGYGTQYFPNTDKAPKKMGPNYQQHKAFRDWLKNFIIDHDIKLVSAENVEVSKSFLALRKLSEFRGILCEVCETLDVPILFVGVAQLKKWMTGNGNASKEDMMNAAVKRFHLDVEGDDNAADAAAIYFYTIRRYNIQ